ncbi:PAS domain-containing protein, partial [Candidatus Peregrinibacteria bacterium]|nr:PAS domain-containing protein [Candidatus Peregrinibacteria bacterium]
MARSAKKPSMFSVLDSLMDYRMFFDLPNIMMLIIDSQEKVTLISPKGCEILGCSENEAEGKNWFDTFLPKEQRGEVKKVYKQIIKGELEPFAHYENYIITKKGKKRLISWHNTYLKDEKGRIRFTLSSGVDITHYEQVKSDLKESEAKYRRLFEKSNDAILVIDKKLNIVDVNHAACRVSGYKKSDCLKMTVAEIVPKEDQMAVGKKLEEGFKKGFTHFPCRGVKANGRLMYVDVNAKVIDKKKGLMLGIIRDLT